MFSFIYNKIEACDLKTTLHMAYRPNGLFVYIKFKLFFKMLAGFSNEQLACRIEVYEDSKNKDKVSLFVEIY